MLHQTPAQDLLLAGLEARPDTVPPCHRGAEVSSGPITCSGLSMSLRCLSKIGRCGTRYGEHSQLPTSITPGLLCRGLHADKLQRGDPLTHYGVRSCTQNVPHL